MHNHDFFLRCEPHLVGLKELKPETAPALPDGVEATGETQTYETIDLVHTLPAGLWDSRVVSTTEITDLADGIFTRIKSPLSVVMDTLWLVKGEDGALELEQAISISCSKLLLGTVKGLCESDWKRIHETLLAGLEPAEPAASEA